MAGIETIQIHPAIGIALVAIGASPQPRLTAVQYAARDDRLRPIGHLSARRDIPTVCENIMSVPNACSGQGCGFARLLRMIIKL
jgi:hypothetical protein